MSALIPNFTKVRQIIVTDTGMSLAEIAPVVRSPDVVRLSSSPLNTAAQVGDMLVLDLVARAGMNRADTVDADLDFDPA